MLPGLNNPDARAGDDQGRTQSLYRAYRPQTFADDELVGQEHVTRTLRNAIARGRVAHAYLFSGPRGTGKTSTARLLAKAVNCLDSDPSQRPCNRCDACLAINAGRTQDVIELDAASHRGIDDIRELREGTRYAPTQLQNKVYVIDEAHRLTKEAFDAFLKTLEEPPPRTIFVLATTEAERLPATIASRCQRFDFHRIPLDKTIERVRVVCVREGIAIDDDALALVARQATGSLRDALSLVDMLASAAGERGAGGIDAELARRMLGLSHDDRAIDVVRAIVERDVTRGLATIAAAVDAGVDMRSFGRHLLGLLRTLLLARAGAAAPEATAEVQELAARVEQAEWLRVTQHFSGLDTALRTGGFPQLPLEMAVVAAIVAPVVPAVPAQRPAMEQPVTRARPAPADPTRFDRDSMASPPAPAPTDRSPSRRAPDSMVAGAPLREPTPIRPPAPSRVDGPRAAGVEPVVTAWERIRAEVKAADRKVEALLASTDPGAFDGQALTLVAAYPFHAGKLNDARVRRLLDEVIGRVLGANVAVTTVARDEFHPPSPAGNGHSVSAAQPASPASAPTTIEEPTVAFQPRVESADAALLQKAKAWLDADEIDTDELD